MLFPTPDALRAFIVQTALEIAQALAPLFTDAGEEVDIEDFIPRPGEAHAAFCDRSGSDPVVPADHKWDPWHVDGERVGGWIPAEAPFTLPPTA